MTDWNSVLLFFNLPTGVRPSGYRSTQRADVDNFMDRGADPAPVPISEFMNKYWETVSYGNLDFGVVAAGDSTGNPLVPILRPADDNAMDWVGLINQYLDLHADQIWRDAGRKMKSRRRWIPSLALVQNYNVGASALFSSYSRTVGGRDYLIGDVTHIKYRLDYRNLPERTENGRVIWSTLAHEYAHNFLEFGDLYGPQGTTGYWDILGDNTPAGRMSEVSSVFKERVGWIDFNHVISGEQYARRSHTLQPYTTSGDAIKVIPNPTDNPSEYFVLEYRKSTGSELWRPDGGLNQEGLLISHFNDRVGVSSSWMARLSPYFDPEFADFTDSGGALWTGWDRLDGVLYPQNRNNSFTRTSRPSSNFYGGRSSGLSITNIRVDRGRCRFDVAIDSRSYSGWTVSGRDLAVAARMHGRHRPHALFVHNGTNAQMLRMLDNQWFAVQAGGRWIGDWELHRTDRLPIVGDFDGDGDEEFYIRNADAAGIIAFKSGSWISETVQRGWIDGWNLGENDWEVVGDFDGDRSDEIVIRSSGWIGVMKLVGTGTSRRLNVQWMTRDNVDRWQLAAGDQLVAGRFRSTTRDDLAMAGQGTIGTFSWSGTTRRLDLIRKQTLRFGSPRRTIGEAGQTFTVGDFDGDGLDEILVKADDRIAMLKWQVDRFAIVWQATDGRVAHKSGDSNRDYIVSESDTMYSGRFRIDRNAVLARTDNGLRLLVWETDRFVVRMTTNPSLGGRWSMGDSDKYVIGQFHPKGPDIGDPTKDYVGDGLMSVFIHNGWGTACLGINHTEGGHEDMGLLWIQRKGILTWIT